MLAGGTGDVEDDGQRVVHVPGRVAGGVVALGVTGGELLLVRLVGGCGGEGWGSESQGGDRPGGDGELEWMHGPEA
jgi:hypothetical protein